MSNKDFWLDISYPKLHMYLSKAIAYTDIVYQMNANVALIQSRISVNHDTKLQ